MILYRLEKTFKKNGRSDSEPCGDKEIMLNFKAKGHWFPPKLNHCWTIGMVNARAARA